MNGFRRVLALLMILVLGVTLCGCSATQEAASALVTATPAPVLTNDPALVYGEVATTRRVVSLVMEGYTDDTTMRLVTDMLAERGVPCVWFVSGVTASEHPDTVRYAAQKGIPLGNYTISAEKELEGRDPHYVVHQVERTQGLILTAAAQLPRMGRCNGTEYTPDVLRAMAAGGLEVAVEPSLYLNHRSFAGPADAQRFVSGVPRGSMLTLKLGQELDKEEFGDVGEELDERPAVDPSPSIATDADEAARSEWEDVVLVLEWLLDALEAEGYQLVTPAALQTWREDVLGEPRTLSDGMAALFDPDAYPLPLTGSPLHQGVKEAQVEDWQGVVFIGGDITDGLAGYVDWRRESDPSFMAGASFVTWSGCSVESAILALEKDQPVGDAAAGLYTALEQLRPVRIYLAAPFDTARAYSQDKYMANLRLLVHMLKTACPGAQVVVQSLTPAADGSPASPDNRQLFRYNMMAARTCCVWSIPFIDVAYALRDEKGALRADCCIDPDTYGVHLSDAGCEAWLLVLGSLLPAD